MDSFFESLKDITKDAGSDVKKFAIGCAAIVALAMIARA